MHILKIGGNELDTPDFLQGLAKFVSNIGEPVVIVHGGGKAIANLQGKLGLATQKVDGLRITDGESLAVAQMVLSGQANKLIVSALLQASVDAVGLSGVDGGILRCQKKQHPTADLGFVGTISHVRTDIIQQLAAQGITAVLSPISLGNDGQTYNVNADEAASAVALALNANILDFISNVPGVLHDGAVVPQLTPSQTEKLIADGIVNGGMIPKVRAALTAATSGVPQARIVNLAGLATAGGTIFYQ